MLHASHAQRLLAPSCCATLRGRTTLCLLVTLLASTASFSAAAQSLFRGVDSNGRAIFSDRMEVIQPPPAQAVALPALAPASKAADPTVELPYALRHAHNKYPVIFYTTGDCNPCDDARRMLLQRGVPYTERSVISETDQKALQALSGQDLLPFTTIGKQHLTGWDEVEWQRYLDLAGYPARSVLPSHWKPAPAAALSPPPPAADSQNDVSSADTAVAADIPPSSANSEPPAKRASSTKRGTPAAVSTNPAGIAF